MSILLINNATDPLNKFDASLRGEYLQSGVFVDTIAGTFTVPARTAIGQFHWIWLVANAATGLLADSPTLAILPPWEEPSASYKRIIGAWGTRDNGTDLVIQMQADRIVMFGHDNEHFLPESFHDFTTEAQWIPFDAYKWVPEGLSCALYARLEGMRSDLTPPNTGLGQVNLASHHGEQLRHWRTQSKMLSDNQFHWGEDWVRCVLEPGSTQAFTYVNQVSRGRIMASGYEIAPGVLPIIVPEAPPVSAWDPASIGANLALSDGNFTITKTGANGWAGAVGSIPYAIGKRVFEITVVVADSNNHYLGFGVHDGSSLSGDSRPSGAYGIINHNSGGAAGDGVALADSTPLSIVSGDRIAFALDLDAGRAWVGRNGTWQGDPAAGTNPKWTWTPGLMRPFNAIWTLGGKHTANFGGNAFGISIPNGFGLWG